MDLRAWASDVVDRNLAGAAVHNDSLTCSGADAAVAVDAHDAVADKHTGAVDGEAAAVADTAAAAVAAEDTGAAGAAAAKDIGAAAVAVHTGLTASETDTVVAAVEPDSTAATAVNVRAEAAALVTVVEAPCPFAVAADFFGAASLPVAPVRALAFAVRPGHLRFCNQRIDKPWSS
jgi:hypothetical protein